MATKTQVWRVVAVPPGDPVSLLDTLFREHDGQWQMQLGTGHWVQAGYAGLNQMRAAGYELKPQRPAACENCGTNPPAPGRVFCNGCIATLTKEFLS